MKRLKGPELKLSGLKVPPVITDLYWDLRDRRLLPLVALVVVAIVAVPFLLGASSDEGAEPSPSSIAGSAPEASASRAASLTVVEATPGLRDYRKRLANRKPTDPFEQRYTAPQLEGAELKTATTTTTSTSVSTSTSSSTGDSSETPSTSGGESPPPSSASDDGGAGEDSHINLFAFAIDVKISKIEGGDGTKREIEPSTKQKVMPTTPLPGEKAPVVTYMGVGKGATRALLMVSNNVKSIFGDAKCLSGTDTCQLLEVEPGLPETFVYGDNDVRYKVNVLKIEPVAVGHT